MLSKQPEEFVVHGWKTRLIQIRFVLPPPPLIIFSAKSHADGTYAHFLAISINFITQDLSVSTWSKRNILRFDFSFPFQPSTSIASTIHVDSASESALGIFSIYSPYWYRNTIENRSQKESLLSKRKAPRRQREN